MSCSQISQRLVVRDADMGTFSFTKYDIQVSPGFSCTIIFNPDVKSKQNNGNRENLFPSGLCFRHEFDDILVLRRGGVRAGTEGLKGAGGLQHERYGLLL